MADEVNFRLSFCFRFSLADCFIFFTGNCQKHFLNFSNQLRQTGCRELGIEFSSPLKGV